MIQLRAADLYMFCTRLDGCIHPWDMRQFPELELTSYRCFAGTNSTPPTVRRYKYGFVAYAFVCREVRR
jgi:hypothetical protein